MHGRLYEFINENPPTSVWALRDRYKRLATRKSGDGKQTWLNWAIKVREEDQFIGYVQATLTRPHRAEIAYVLAYNFWKKGYGREAVIAMLYHLRSQYWISEIYARVDPRNIRSIRLITAIGGEMISDNVGIEHDVEAEYVFKGA